MNILSITVANILSFDEEQTIKFEGSLSNAFVGGNGVGKTNVLCLFMYIKECFLNTDKQKRRILSSFDGKNQVSKLSIDFMIDQIEYRYEIQFLSEKSEFLLERLSKKEDKNNILILDNTLDTDIGSFTSIEKERVMTYPFKEIGIYTLINAKEIVVSDESIINELEKVKKFFEKFVFFGFNDVDNSFTYEEILYKNREVKDKVIKFMNLTGYGIEDIIIDERRIDLESIESKSGELSKLIDALRELTAINKFPVEITKYEFVGLRRTELNTIISPGNESFGIKRLMEMMTWIYNFDDCFLFIDEIEHRFHERLLFSIIHEIKKSGTQVFFTSHLLETLSALEKKELYSVYKNKCKTQVLKASDIPNLRNDRHSLKNQYRVGKIPGYPIYEDH